MSAELVSWILSANFGLGPRAGWVRFDWLRHCVRLSRYFFGGPGAGATADVVTPSEVADAAAAPPGDADASADGARPEDADADARDVAAAFLAAFVTWESLRP
jgi:hypothetical protein